MQIVDRNQVLAIPPLWRLGFRPFFLAGSTLALLAIPLWLAALLGLFADWQPTGGWLAWHRHEMVFGFVVAIIAGFLLTAVQTWTGRVGLSGKPLMALTAVWLAARFGWLLGLPPLWLLPLELAFLPAVAVLMAQSLWAVKQSRNYPVVLVLSLLAAADAVVMAGLVTANEDWQRRGVLAALWLIIALIGLIGGRVIPFFTQRGLRKPTAIVPWPWLDNGLLGGTLLIAVCYALGLGNTPQLGLAILLMVVATGHGVRWLRWHDVGLWRVPLLWSLYLAYLWLIVGMLGVALWHLGVLTTISPAFHALTMGAISGMILAMIARVTLGHTGRPLQEPAAMSFAFALLHVGVAVRVFGVMGWPTAALVIASSCWTLAFALYLWYYAPMLCQARIDGNMG